MDSSIWNRQIYSKHQFWSFLIAQVPTMFLYVKMYNVAKHTVRTTHKFEYKLTTIPIEKKTEEGLR